MMTSNGKTMIGRRASLLLAAIMAALVLSSGMALAVTKTCKTYVLGNPETICNGTKERDKLLGTDATNFMVGKRGNDTLKGFGSHDYLIGGPGKDALSGDGDYDFYYFGNGWGRDTITDDQGSNNELLFRNSSSPDALYVTDDLIIDLNSGAGPEVTNTSGTNTINWEGNVILSVSSGEGDDHITGNGLANLLSGGAGADTIFGGQGDDEIDVLDGAADDTVDCGEPPIVYTDNDFVLRDPGDDIDPNCEVTSTLP